MDAVGDKDVEPPCRVFLVGCPRSGTTLLQAMLAAHPRVHSLPETHFFQNLLRCEDHRRLPRAFSGDDRLLRRLQVARRRWMVSSGWTARRRAHRAWDELAGAEHPCLKGQRLARIQEQVAHFIDMLDRQCREAGKQVWLEKTPDHLFYVEHIQRDVAGARFVHLVRDGDEVVASLYDAACRYPDWRPFLDVGRAVERWNLAVRESLRWIGHPQHLVVRYEALLAAPETVLRQIAGFIGCEFSERMLAPVAQSVQALVREDEPWKRGVGRGLQDRRKFQCMFDGWRQAEVRRRLLALDWSALSRRERVIADM